MTTARRLILCLVALLLIALPAHAEVEFNKGSSMSSSNFRVLDPQHAAFGGTSSSSSTTFRLLGAIGDLAIGSSSAALISLRSGFLYFPLIIEPILNTATPGTNQVSLAWTAAIMDAGLKVGDYNVCTKPPVGSFTCQNTGPGTSFTKTGLTAGTTYTFKIQAKDALGNIVAESNQLSATPTSAATPTPTPGGGGGGGGGCIGSACGGGGGGRLEMFGLAYPRAIVHLLRDGVELASTVADIAAQFTFDLQVPSGQANYGLWATDTSNRRSVTWTFLVDVSSSTPTIIRGLIIPPTIALSTTSVSPGQPIQVSGASAPNATVRVALGDESHQTTTIAGGIDDGNWTLSFSTAGLPIGQYNMKARTEFPPAQDRSTWSQLVRFAVGQPAPTGQCNHPPDINHDGHVNLTDFSILAYWWRRQIPPDSPVDLNCDGQVTLADFSILAFFWTG